MFRVSMVRLSHKPKYFVGTVFSDKMDKTISVSGALCVCRAFAALHIAALLLLTRSLFSLLLTVNSYRLHPKYRKVVRTTNKFFAHDGGQFPGFLLPVRVFPRR